MLSFLKTLHYLIQQETVCIDNIIFKLHYKFTATNLIIYSIIISSTQYIGDAIECITTDEQTSKAINNFCWVASTFTVNSSHGQLESWKYDSIPGVNAYTPNKNKENYQDYYRWTYFALFFQGLLYYLPHVLWKTWEGGRIELLTTDLKLISLKELELKIKSEQLIKYFAANINNHKSYFIKYIICEWLNFINVVIQILFVDYSLNGQFMTYGQDIIHFVNTKSGVNPADLVFPKLTKCTFNKYGSSGTMEVDDALCLLPINNINDKIYLLLWFWFFILGGLSFMTVVYRMIIVCSSKMRLQLLLIQFKFQKEKDVEYVSKKLDNADWFMLYQATFNMDSRVREKVIKDVATYLGKRD